MFGRAQTPATLSEAHARAWARVDGPRVRVPRAEANMTVSPKASERRDGPRIDLRLRVRWSAPGQEGVSGEAEASDVSPKGLRLESEHKLDKDGDLDLVVDVGGDGDELVAKGKVMWCRERGTPTGRPIYDVGVSFESDWLAKDRGPLGQALARIFAMNSYEPARTFERTQVSLTASGSSLAGGTLTIVNLSAGGMQVRADGSLGEALRAGAGLAVVIDVDKTPHSMKGRVAWVAAARPDGGESVGDRFGVEFVDLSDADRTLLERIRMGQAEPTSMKLSLS